MLSNQKGAPTAPSHCWWPDWSTVKQRIIFSVSLLQYCKLQVPKYTVKITEVPDSVFSILFLPAKYKLLDKMLSWIADLLFISPYNCSVLCFYLILLSFLLLFLLLLPFSTIQAFFFVLARSIPVHIYSLSLNTLCFCADPDPIHHSTQVSSLIFHWSAFSF